jgi:hypothetical protein
VVRLLGCRYLAIDPMSHRKARVQKPVKPRQLFQVGPVVGRTDDQGATIVKPGEEGEFVGQSRESCFRFSAVSSLPAGVFLEVDSLFRRVRIRPDHRYPPPPGKKRRQERHRRWEVRLCLSEGVGKRIESTQFMKETK